MVSSNQKNNDSHHFVLYGSQTGNSAQSAQDYADQQQQQQATTVCTLDDFLEIHHAPWTTCVVIFCSSYGTGQAPLGAERFRQYCNALLESKISDDEKPLQGLGFCLQGRGDSKNHPATFFVNPSTIRKALLHAGAVEIFPMCTIDVGGNKKLSNKAQEEEKLIQQWNAQAVRAVQKWQEGGQGPGPEQLKAMKVATQELCRQVIPGYTGPNSGTDGSCAKFGAAFVVLLLAVACGIFYKQ